MVAIRSLLVAGAFAGLSAAAQVGIAADYVRVPVGCTFDACCTLVTATDTLNHGIMQIKPSRSLLQATPPPLTGDAQLVNTVGALPELASQLAQVSQMRSVLAALYMAVNCGRDCAPENYVFSAYACNQL